MIQPLAFPSVILQIIEEFTDGFLILDERGEIVFFNDVFLRLTGWRSGPLLAQQMSILAALRPGLDEGKETRVAIPDSAGVPAAFRAAPFTIESGQGRYTLLRIKTADPESAARESYERLFNNVGDALISVDLNGAILAANPSFYKLVQSDKDSGPHNIEEIYISHKALENKMMRLLDTGSLYNVETHIRTSGDATKRLLDTSWVNRNEDGVVAGYTSQFRDTTYVTNLEERLQISERNYLVLFDTVLSAVMIVDPHGIIINWNYGAEQIYGHKWADVVGHRWDAVLGDGIDRTPLEQTLALAQQNNGRHVETGVPRTCRDGSIKYVYASYSVLKNSFDEILGYSIMERDLTEHIRLERKLKDSFRNIKETQAATILGFAALTEYRDKDTGKHLERIRDYTRVLATALRERPSYRGYISDDYIDDLCLSSVLHDIGKVGIEDQILLKPGKLTEAEFARIKDHAKMGGDALKVVDSQIKRESFLTLGKEIAYHHHEWWDGSGYPAGLRGEEIPLSARIVTVADVYDALTTARPYKDALSHEKTREMIREERGTHFDPEIVDCFLNTEAVFKRIKVFNDFQDNPKSLGDIIARPSQPQ